VELKSSAVIYSDSQLLVNQMEGRWGIKDGLYIPYFVNCRDIIREYRLLPRLVFKWIPREQNTEADRLSKLALASVGLKQ